MGRSPRSGPPRSDVGTILLHWLTAVAMVASLVTGLRIAADAPEAVISRALSPVLPQGEVWTVHVVAGLTLFFAAGAYVVYLRRSGLERRVALKKLRVFQLPAANRLRWGAVNVALHWTLYGLVIVLTASGVALYLGHGGWIVPVHTVAALATLVYILVHVLAHYGYGGWGQLLRLFRPSALVVTAAVRPRPLLVAGLVGAGVAAALAGLDWSTRDLLPIIRVGQAPVLDGVLDDPAWKASRAVSILTQQGTGLGGRGESTVEVRAVHDGQAIHFAFRWQDPTRSLRRLPLVKKADGWHMVDGRADRADVIDFYEDKFSVIFSRSNAFGGGGGTHLGPRPLADRPPALNDRGLHYTTDGSIIDMWQWKASRGGLLGHVDDQFIGPPLEPTPKDWDRTARYQGGYTGDPGRAFYAYNYRTEPPGGYRGPVGVQRLPKDLAATRQALGTFDLDPNSSDGEGARWWMTEAESVPYSPEVDAAIPVGTVIPGVLIMGEYSGDRADVRGSARWKDGWWTLEATRRLATGSRYDVDFLPGEPLYMWVAVFDHTQTRHTRHMRPVRLELR
ncbi:ethylbenzene dehydrogenase-related protein [Chelatococcus sp. SYSU_G07232]|uniref:Ethylbenzene dehydrogenase-related protein n=1 Tax=Chelatococcus albus TaxID=3047466 RepID=A0ABT7AIB5_9HYPH|nr:ethylbenzene dehydrogenase-related protein [Chelatococcus sp. SYSU_G07232]MDJ1159122.1 ethylbenzene dehydrogenase-related protein [Chelatococcus sp. SYSU_G07232]